MYKRIRDVLFTEKTGAILVVIGVIIIVAAFIAFVFFSHWSFSRTLDEAIVGQFGDFVGGVVGTLFALVGVVLYYVALTEQRKDLKINQSNLQIQTNALTQQIEEFRAQKEEMAETRRVYEQQTELFQEQTNLYREQSETMKKQAEEAKKQTVISLVEQFESSFYSLINMICEAQRNNLSKIEEIYNSIQSKIDERERINDTYDKILNEYVNQYQEDGESIGRMFDMISQLLRLIHKAPMLEDGKKKHFISILHSQLSICTKVLLFYHLFSDAGNSENSLYIQSRFFDEMKFMKRCEFVPLYSSNQYLALSKFADVLHSFIRKSLENAKSLNGLPGVVDEKIYLMGVEVQSQLRQEDNSLCYNLIVPQENWKVTGLDKNNFCQFLTFLLHDVRDIRTFVMPMADKVISKMEEKDGKLTFSYEIIID